MKEILTTLFRRKGAFLAFLACMIVFPMTLAYVLPPKYEGKATLLLTPGRFKKPFLPDERDNRISFMQVSMEDVGSEVEILTSQPVLARVVEQNRLDRAGTASPDASWAKRALQAVARGINGTLVATGLRPALPPTDAAIGQLAGQCRSSSSSAPTSSTSNTGPPPRSWRATWSTAWWAPTWPTTSRCTATPTCWRR